MTETPEPVNPYKSPRLLASEDAPRIVDTDLARQVRRAEITFDLLIVLVCIVFPVIFWEMGTDLARRGAELSGLLARAGPAAICWTAWTAGLVVRFCVQIFFGWMLGRFLRRLNLWRVVALIVVCLAAVAVWFIASWHIAPLELDRHMDVFNVGYQGYVVQVLISALAASGVVVGGAWLGQRSQRVADLKMSEGDSPSGVVSSMYGTFTVGQREVHEVGVLFTWAGREILTVDGEKKLERRSFAQRGTRSLAVGDDERHDVTIQFRALPFWTVEVFVDGQRHTKNLLPDVRLLSKMIMTMLAVLVAIAVTMASLLVFMMTSAV